MLELQIMFLFNKSLGWEYIQKYISKREVDHKNLYSVSTIVTGWGFEGSCDEDGYLKQSE